MTRIIGGTAGGRRLATPKGDATRPTSDRVREALFSAVEAWCGSWAGLRILDLYAGSGALGLEAASRGAAAVLLVEKDKRTAELIRRNARDLALPARVEVRSSTVRAALAAPPDQPYDLVLADPPYPLASGAVDTDLATLVDQGWLTDDALVVVERSSRTAAPTWPAGFGDARRRQYGETTLWSALWAAPENAPPENAEE
ncbi:16S rRNA (guanine(966)-N(2))-methyltransferase RsmD [Nocardioides acrostichi]|uniref:16S rRNA (Guanine(966)-N(2))-methyltransferase RsmD n=1 Tax=Nocardioides acrostichi TaxID=2784339 RepID=A0A930UY68_9ACTN|nr:16S rRNA (guanine(966)-N(2))-methyltransferase RsmD [Nocardioides acrostichi]MBF4160426.1 16S rRNA (guanine(966)-N(2))-methyltransferase RsmD [Nocardioides acrostichi]